MTRACLILALAVAEQGRTRAPQLDARPPLSRVGTVIATTADGALTVAMRYGRSTLLVLASDAWIRMATGPATLADIAVGDVVTWLGDASQPVSYVTDITVTTAG